MSEEEFLLSRSEEEAFIDGNDDPDILKYLNEQPLVQMCVQNETHRQEYPQEYSHNKVFTYELMSILIDKINFEPELFEILVKFYISFSFHQSYLNNLNTLNILCDKLKIFNCVSSFKELIILYDKKYINKSSSKILPLNECIVKAMSQDKSDLVNEFLLQASKSHNIDKLNIPSLINMAIAYENHQSLSILLDYFSFDKEKLSVQKAFLKEIISLGNYDTFKKFIDRASVIWDRSLYEAAIKSGNVSIFDSIVLKSRLGFSNYSLLELSIESNSINMVKRIFALLTAYANLPPQTELISYLNKSQNISILKYLVDYLVSIGVTHTTLFREVAGSYDTFDTEQKTILKIFETQVDNILYDIINQTTFVSGDSLLIKHLLLLKPKKWAFEKYDIWLAKNKSRLSPQRIAEIDTLIQNI
jgi:hypothetical protein